MDKKSVIFSLWDNEKITDEDYNKLRFHLVELEKLVSKRSEHGGCDNCADYKQGYDIDKYCLVCNRMVEL